MRSPAVMQQLGLLTHYTCTAHASASPSCAAHTCGSSLFSMIGFAGGLPGIVGALCGLLACVTSSILMCCAPKSTAEGGGKFMAVRNITQATTTPASLTPQPNAHSYPILA